ncbi:MAG: hypothetical protein QGD94_07900, partial [Planctomycetia bacterium]|nr:hypothetical protein [Planctomycetia bacterium]
MRATCQLALALTAVALGGCIAGRTITEAEMDRYWFLQETGWAEGRPETLSIGKRTLPSKWVIRQEPSLIRSTISIVRAIDALKTGVEEIEFSLSPAHMNIVADAFARARKTISSLREIAEPDSPPTAKRWAASTARLLANVEGTVRLMGEAGGESDRELLGWSARPLMEMALAYIDKRSGGNLLGNLDVEEADRLRQVVTQLVLRASFALGGKQEPPDLRPAVTRVMRRAKRARDVESSLKDILKTHFEKAPPEGGAGELRSVLNTVLSSAPRMLEVLEMLFRQWDKMDSVTIEFRRVAGHSVVAVTLKVAPRRRVKIDDLFIMQPAIVFRGSTRIIVLPAFSKTGETVIAFEPVDGGACEIRFDGFGYALVRLLALPISSASLREIRVSTKSQRVGGRMFAVAMLMEATGDRKD